MTTFFHTTCSQSELPNAKLIDAQKGHTQDSVEKKHGRLALIAPSDLARLCSDKRGVVPIESLAPSFPRLASPRTSVGLRRSTPRRAKKKNALVGKRKAKQTFQQKKKQRPKEKTQELVSKQEQYIAPAVAHSVATKYNQALTGFLKASTAYDQLKREQRQSVKNIKTKHLDISCVRPKQVNLRTLYNFKMHQSRRRSNYHPSLWPYVNKTKHNVPYFNLIKMQRAIVQACRFLSFRASQGQRFLFVSTKKIRGHVLATAAKKCRSGYVSQKWLGGLLTNWRTIRSSVRTLRRLDFDYQFGYLQKLPKKEFSRAVKRRAKLDRTLGGLKHTNTRKAPNALVIFGSTNEHHALKEMRQTGIRVKKRPSRRDYMGQYNRFRAVSSRYAQVAPFKKRQVKRYIPKFKPERKKSRSKQAQRQKLKRKKRLLESLKPPQSRRILNQKPPHKKPQHVNIERQSMNNKTYKKYKRKKYKQINPEYKNLKRKKYKRKNEQDINPQPSKPHQTARQKGQSGKTQHTPVQRTNPQGINIQRKRHGVLSNRLPVRQPKQKRKRKQTSKPVKQSLSLGKMFTVLTRPSVDLYIRLLSSKRREDLIQYRNLAKQNFHFLAFPKKFMALAKKPKGLYLEKRLNSEIKKQIIAWKQNPAPFQFPLPQRKQNAFDSTAEIRRGKQRPYARKNRMAKPQYARQRKLRLNDIKLSQPIYLHGTYYKTITAAKQATGLTHRKLIQTANNPKQSKTFFFNPALEKNQIKYKPDSKSKFQAKPPKKRRKRELKVRFRVPVVKQKPKPKSKSSQPVLKRNPYLKRNLLLKTAKRKTMQSRPKRLKHGPRKNKKAQPARNEKIKSPGGKQRQSTNPTRDKKAPIRGKKAALNTVKKPKRSGAKGGSLKAGLKHKPFFTSSIVVNGRTYGNIRHAERATRIKARDLWLEANKANNKKATRKWLKANKATNKKTTNKKITNRKTNDKKANYKKANNKKANYKKAPIKKTRTKKVNNKKTQTKTIRRVNWNQFRLARPLKPTDTMPLYINGVKYKNLRKASGATKMAYDRLAQTLIQPKAKDIYFSHYKKQNNAGKPAMHKPILPFMTKIENSNPMAISNLKLKPGLNLEFKLNNGKKHGIKPATMHESKKTANGHLRWKKKKSKQMIQNAKPLVNKKRKIKKKLIQGKALRINTRWFKSVKQASKVTGISTWKLTKIANKATFHHVEFKSKSAKRKGQQVRKQSTLGPEVSRGKKNKRKKMKKRFEPRPNKLTLKKPKSTKQPTLMSQTNKIKKYEIEYSKKQKVKGKSKQTGQPKVTAEKTEQPYDQNKISLAKARATVVLVANKKSSKTTSANVGGAFKATDATRKLPGSKKKSNQNSPKTSRSSLPSTKKAGAMSRTLTNVETKAAKRIKGYQKNAQQQQDDAVTDAFKSRPLLKKVKRVSRSTPEQSWRNAKKEALLTQKRKLKRKLVSNAQSARPYSPWSNIIDRSLNNPKMIKPNASWYTPTFQFNRSYWTPKQLVTEARLTLGGTLRQKANKRVKGKSNIQKQKLKPVYAPLASGQKPRGIQPKTQVQPFTGVKKTLSWSPTSVGTKVKPSTTKTGLPRGKAKKDGAKQVSPTQALKINKITRTSSNVEARAQRRLTAAQKPSTLRLSRRKKIEKAYKERKKRRVQRWIKVQTLIKGKLKRKKMWKNRLLPLPQKHGRFPLPEFKNRVKPFARRKKQKRHKHRKARKALRAFEKRKTFYKRRRQKGFYKRRKQKQKRRPNPFLKRKRKKRKRRTITKALRRRKKRLRQRERKEQRKIRRRWKRKKARQRKRSRRRRRRPKPLATRKPIRSISVIDERSNPDAADIVVPMHYSKASINLVLNLFVDAIRNGQKVFNTYCRDRYGALYDLYSAKQHLLHCRRRLYQQQNHWIKHLRKKQKKHQPLVPLPNKKQASTMRNPRQQTRPGFAQQSVTKQSIAGVSPQKQKANIPPNPFGSSTNVPPRKPATKARPQRPGAKAEPQRPTIKPGLQKPKTKTKVNRKSARAIHFFGQHYWNIHELLKSLGMKRMINIAKRAPRPTHRQKRMYIRKFKLQLALKLKRHTKKRQRPSRFRVSLPRKLKRHKLFQQRFYEILNEMFRNPRYPVYYLPKTRKQSQQPLESVNTVQSKSPKAIKRRPRRASKINKTKR